MDENEFLLEDRIAKIRSINDQYNLLDNAYLSFSGGKDSTILHYLLDLALPGNKIPRVFINTGIEYKDIVGFVKEMVEKDDRFNIINPSQNIKVVLEKYGYPFKSKQHSHNLAIFQNSGMTLTNLRYLGIKESKTKFRCPKSLEYQFSDAFDTKVSDSCCLKLKKEPVKKWSKDNSKSVILTGMRKGEGGKRGSIGCITTAKDGSLTKFHPLLVVDDQWETWFIEKYDIELCKLYYPPFNFKRTGCKGCPFSLDLQKQLEIMKQLLPNEYHQCEVIWKPIYDEYRRINYRLGGDDIGRE